MSHKWYATVPILSSISTPTDSTMTKRIAPLESSREIWLARKISEFSETVGVGTFFEASRFGCRKTIFNAKKVTYSMYSCTISGMSREMMKMDG